MHFSGPIRRILAGMGICAVTCIATLFAYMAAGWGLLDAAYMVVITIFGVGYGEVRPISDPLLKIQTIALIVVGGLSGLYSCGGFIQLLTEGEIKRAIGAQKMSRGIKRMKDHAIICGFGRVGQMLAAQLQEERIPCVVIENSQKRLDLAEEHGLAIVFGDASNDETLEKAGIQRAKTLASVLPNDAINVFITLTARDLNPDIEIIARAECPTTEHKLRRSGANHVVMPAVIGALRMAEIIGGRRLMPGVPGTQSVERDPVNSSTELEQQTLDSADELLNEVASIVAVRRADRELVSNLAQDPC